MLLLGPVVFPLPSKAPEIIKQTSAPEKAALAHPHTCSPAYLSSLILAMSQNIAPYLIYDNDCCYGRNNRQCCDLSVPAEISHTIHR
ncbi:hypothetical protein J6590_087896 [Homalodisca vitripennis]|nr:hypothetical protein J6590_087896 [Homalodisca vitripennis]